MPPITTSTDTVLQQQHQKQPCASSHPRATISVQFSLVLFRLVLGATVAIDLIPSISNMKLLNDLTLESVMDAQGSEEAEALKNQTFMMSFTENYFIVFTKPKQSL